MGIDIGNNLIAKSGANLLITAGAAMEVLAAGSVRRPNQPQFIAVGNAAGTWIVFADGTWNKVVYPTALLNIGACYNTTTQRFTAPVTGMYFFQACTYLNKINAVVSQYCHPVFYVNGFGAGGAVNTSSPNYRIRGYGIPVGTYLDSQVTEVYSLAAGDYVEHYCYVSVGFQHHTPYSRFTGFLLG